MILSDKRGTPNLSHAILKSALRILISKFGIYLINDKISEIFAEEENESGCDYSYDDISEMYDNINFDLRVKEFKSSVSNEKKPKRVNAFKSRF